MSDTAIVSGGSVAVLLDHFEKVDEQWRSHGPGAREEWVLEAHAGDGRRVDLNGAVLDGVDAPLAPRVVDGDGAFEAPPWSLAFVRYPNLRPPACA